MNEWNMVNSLNPGVSVICLAWSSRWWLSLERLLLVTDGLSTTQVVKMSVTNNSLPKDNHHPDDHAKQIMNEWMNEQTNKPTQQQQSTT